MSTKNRTALLLLSTAIATAAIGCTLDDVHDGDASAPDAADPDDGGDGGDGGAGPVAACTIPPIDINRSLFVSPPPGPDQGALRMRFPVSRIMQHILASSGAASPTSATELWRRWWDTQAPSSAAQFPDNPHCSDNSQTINGFPVQCPRNERALATAPVESHFPVALIYRPDLAARDGSTCGEARIVIAKQPDGTGRNLAIFEASIPNPSPGCGMVGCRKVAQFWANLSTIPNFGQRLGELERFFFVGLNQAQDGVVTRPALDAQNLGLPDASGARRGQIRTNQFMAGPGQLWQLREFRLARACSGGAPSPSCRLFFAPASVKTNPFGPLFNDTAPAPLGIDFRADFPGQVEALAPQDVNAIGMSMNGIFDAGQSNAQGPENQYGAHFAQGNPLGFRAAIGARLGALGIALSPEDIVARATTQSCGGCHQLSNNAPLGGQDAQGLPLRWPPSAGFVHVREDGSRSPALNTAFLPRRRQLLEQLLADTCNATCAAPLAPDPTPLAGKAMVH